MFSREYFIIYLWEFKMSARNAWQYLFFLYLHVKLSGLYSIVDAGIDIIPLKLPIVFIW